MSFRTLEAGPRHTAKIHPEMTYVPSPVKLPDLHATIPTIAAEPLLSRPQEVTLPLHTEETIQEVTPPLRTGEDIFVFKPRATVVETTGPRQRISPNEVMLAAKVVAEGGAAASQAIERDGVKKRYLPNRLNSINHDHWR